VVVVMMIPSCPAPVLSSCECTRYAGSSMMALPPWWHFPSYCYACRGTLSPPPIYLNRVCLVHIHGWVCPWSSMYRGTLTSTVGAQVRRAVAQGALFMSASAELARAGWHSCYRVGDGSVSGVVHVGSGRCLLGGSEPPLGVWMFWL
jgi:hypothetical protein